MLAEASAGFERIRTRPQKVRVRELEFHFDCVDNLDQTIDLLARQTDRFVTSKDVCPHFGVVWPSALALSEYLCDIWSVSFKNSSIIELGCGLALPSLTARRLGCENVIASDRHSLVANFLESHTRKNALPPLAYRSMDWRDLECDQRFDVILGSDLLYEAWQPAFLAHAISQLLGGHALIADPGRGRVEMFKEHLRSFDLVVVEVIQREVTLGRSRSRIQILKITRI